MSGWGRSKRTTRPKYQSRPGRHTLRFRNGRKSSNTEAFDPAEGEIVAFRCTEKRFLRSFWHPSSFPGWH